MARDHGFHALRVREVVTETADAATFVLDIPDELRDLFRYQSGQFCTFRASVGGETLMRCYSMASAPEVDDELYVTVKRVPGGAVSNWMIDNLHAGDEVDVTAPAGVFTLQPDAHVVAFAGGSGITPVISVVKTALAATDRSVRLLYANRDRESVIFDDVLRALDDAHDRLELVHHLDAESGYLASDDITGYVDASGDSQYYVCGPTPFMDLVEGALLDAGVAADHIHLERFGANVPVPTTDVADGGAGGTGGDDAAEPHDAATDEITVTIEIGGKSETTTWHAGTTILQTGRQLGLSPPSSCESGSCATCMAKCTEGTVKMYVNDALTEDEVEEGWILTCQSIPTSPTVHVVYEDY